MPGGKSGSPHFPSHTLRVPTDPEATAQGMASSPARLQFWALAPLEKKSCTDNLLTFYKADFAPSFEAQIIVKTTVFASLGLRIIVKTTVFASLEA